MRKATAAPEGERTIARWAFLLSGMLLTLWTATASAQFSPSLGVEAVALSPTTVRIYWNRVSRAAQYTIFRNGQHIGHAKPDSVEFTDITAQPNTTYRYNVQSQTGDGLAASGSYIERTFPILPAERSCDVLVVGATTGGVAAAITAARYGLDVVLIEETRRLGGMPVNGLGSTDLRRLSHASGLFEEFRKKIQGLYGSGDGLRYEPRVAQQAIKEMLWAEPRLTVFRQVRPTRVRKRGDQIAEVVAEELPSGMQVRFHPKIVVDATDCGDVAAWAGAPFRLWREPRSKREPHAGYIFYDRASDRTLAGSTGRGDRRIQAYAYLMTVQDFGRGADKIIPKPPGYDARKYEHAPKWEESWAVTSGELPNHKFEVNQHPQGSDLQEINYRYALASYAERRRIEQAYRDHALGYLYYLQTVEGKKNLGLSEDDYRDSDGWPQLLYIREARRFESYRVVDESDIASRPLHPDSVGLGDYPMDSHAVETKRDWSTPDFGEGEFYLPQWTPWHQVPYDIMIPRRISNCFVPTAVSATHVAYGTLRLEPIRMELGEAAGIAAYLSLRYGVQPRDVPVRQIQSELLKTRPATADHPALDGIGGPGPSAEPARLYDLPDITVSERNRVAIQWLAARGFYPAPLPEHNGPVAGLNAVPFNPNEPATVGEMIRLLKRLADRAEGADALRASRFAAMLERANTLDLKQSLTRLEAAYFLSGFMNWSKPHAVPQASHYADRSAPGNESEAVEVLYSHWIDSRLWDSPPRYGADGKLLFNPTDFVTRSQLAELIYLANFYFGPLWEDHPLDRR